jgi:hypothetical protein
VVAKEYARVLMTAAGSLGHVDATAGELAWTSRVDNTFGQPAKGK